MDDFWLALTCQRHLQILQAGLRGKAVPLRGSQGLQELSAVGEAFSEGVQVPGEEIHDCHQVQGPFPQGDVGDSSGPHLIHPGDLLDVHQAGKPLRWLAVHGGPWFLVDRP